MLLKLVSWNCLILWFIGPFYFSIHRVEYKKSISYKLQELFLFFPIIELMLGRILVVELACVDASSFHLLLEIGHWHINELISHYVQVDIFIFRIDMGHDRDSLVARIQEW